jgi:hypothetical protein
MSECPNCERYKKSAAMWRNEAYKLAGTPLPWEPDELWVGLTHEEKHYLNDVLNLQGRFAIIEVIEAKLKEKNGG